MDQNSIMILSGSFKYASLCKPLFFISQHQYEDLYCNNIAIYILCDENEF